MVLCAKGQIALEIVVFRVKFLRKIMATKYTETENMFLVQMIAQHRVIAENKKTDAVSLKEKQAAWNKIQCSYCSPSFPTKSVKELKKCWDNIKKKKRQQNTLARQNRLLTGGGSPKEVTSDPVTDFPGSAFRAIDVELRNDWDSTAAFEKKNLSFPLATKGNDAVMDNRTSLSPLNDESSHCAPLPCQPSTSASMEAVPEQLTPAPVVQKALHLSNRRMLSKRTCSCNDELIQLQIKKVKDGIDQQRELHEKRMEAANAEARLAMVRLRKKS
ncbi:unnamed protein product [Ceutorhynchus assimilis]|uniref:Regulatory protein zeste n=1 Tax=Ceutorhynchus assimilis TaxID=467358 RepID=A0A9N9MBG2_9CUCU|nr:unnamed protein product [Ceutorhynchus assimilis]